MSASQTGKCGGPADSAAGCCGAAPTRRPASGGGAGSQPSGEAAAKEVVRREYGRIGAGQQEGCGCGDLAVAVAAPGDELPR